ncbi:hypothetical protein CRG98_035071 [Punica granatum]|uniref:Uncharacterized protein n=1 Tax=Punica granatum TaxID=22663 RepID=A0A2I0ILA3_PUNGR|nr:hypothetical protein CRG98_035071 [Punica granatum]
MGNGAEVTKPNRKPKARLPPLRGQIKVRIFKLFSKELRRLFLCSSPVAAPALRENSPRSRSCSSKEGSVSTLPNR